MILKAIRDQAAANCKGLVGDKRMYNLRYPKANYGNPG